MKKVRPPNKVPMPFFIVLVAASFTFQNCERPVQSLSRGPASTFQAGTVSEVRPEDLGGNTYTDPLQAAAEPFANGKMQISKVSGQSLQGMALKGFVPPITGDDTLIVILDNECVRKRPGQLSGLAYDPSREFKGLPSQAYKWSVPQTMSLVELEAAAEADDCVIGISHDDVMHAGGAPNDTSLSSQNNFRAVGGAESFGFFKDPLRGSTSTVVVAVIDSGINHTHEDLKNRLWNNGSGGYGYNFLNHTTSVYDDYGHGTAVAGILGAESNNGVGIAGTMGQNVQLMSLKVQNSTGQATFADIVLAIDYARARAVDVINISMEGNNVNAALQSALQSAVASGIFVAVAAGNGGGEISPSNIIVPAYYSSGISGMMSVGSIDSYSSARSSFSNYGPTYVEISAPGSNGVMYTHRNGGYGTGVGTSYASPMVAGAGALTISFLKKNGIAYTPALIETILNASAIKRPGLTSAFADGRMLSLSSLSEYLRRTYLTPVDGGYDEN
jgi:hypothetical protein